MCSKVKLITCKEARRTKREQSRKWGRKVSTYRCPDCGLLHLYNTLFWTAERPKDATLRIDWDRFIKLYEEQV